MNNLVFEHNWLHLDGREDPANQATFAEFRIVVGGQCVTEVMDKKAKSTRDSIIVPLYPLAEWIVANWWALFGECQVPKRSLGAGEYLSRHSFRNASGGYGFPDFRIHPEGEWTLLEWQPLSTQHMPLDFIAAGTWQIRTEELIETASDLVEAILGRLDSQDVKDTWLEQEWIQLRKLPKEEKEFCTAAGWLGLDPYEIEADQARVLVRTWETLPTQFREELFRAADASTIRQSAEWIHTGLQAIQADATSNGKWQKLRERIPRLPLRDKPWKEGYELARNVRKTLRLADAAPLPLEQLTGDSPIFLEATLPPARTLDGVFGASSTRTPCCYTSRGRSDAKRFLFARGLLNYLYGPLNQPDLLSSAQDVCQKRGRAFAANYWRRHPLIKSRLSGEDVTTEEIEDLAGEFEVSSYVVELQIRNHKLGNVIALD